MSFERRRGAWLLLVAAVVFGCSTPEQRVRSSFSALFECETVTVKVERRGHYTASGCGHTGRYECNQSRCEAEGGISPLEAEREERAASAGRAPLRPRDQGATRSVLFTAETNLAAQRAYTSLGYQIAGDFGLVLY